MITAKQTLAVVGSFLLMNLLCGGCVLAIALVPLEQPRVFSPDSKPGRTVRLDIPAECFERMDYEIQRKLCVAYSLAHSTGPDDIPDVDIHDQATGRRIGRYVIGLGMVTY